MFLIFSHHLFCGFPCFSMFLLIVIWHLILWFFSPSCSFSFMSSYVIVFASIFCIVSILVVFWHILSELYVCIHQAYSFVSVHMVCLALFDRFWSLCYIISPTKVYLKFQGYTLIDHTHSWEPILAAENKHKVCAHDWLQKRTTPCSYTHPWEILEML